MVECGFGSETSSGWRAALGRPDEAETWGWTLGVVNVLGKLSSLDSCHHPGAGQILTTTDAPRFPTCLRKESRGNKVDRREPQYLKLTALVDREAYHESIRIFENLLELIENCTTGCQFSHRAAESIKVVSCDSLNSDVIMTGTVRFYGLMATVDLLTFLLTANLGISVDLSGIENLN